MKKNFIWKGRKPKIKRTTLRNSYGDGGLKYVDIFYKIVSLQCSWIKRLFDDNFHDWKVIFLCLIKTYFGENFKFHSNLDIGKCPLKQFLKFYQEILTRWSKYLSFPVSTPSTITSQFLWFYKDIKVDEKCIYFKDLSKNGLNFVGQLFNLNGTLKSWTTFKNEYKLSESKKFQWMQLTNSLRRS